MHLTEFQENINCIQNFYLGKYIVSFTVAKKFLWFMLKCCHKTESKDISPQMKILNTVKPILSVHSKRRPRLDFMTDYRLMQVKSIAECSMRAFCHTFDLH